MVTTDNDMANTLNIYFYSVFTYEQLNNIPQLPRYVGNTLDTSNFRQEDVQKKMNVYKSTGPAPPTPKGPANPGKHALWTPKPHL